MPTRPSPTNPPPLRKWALTLERALHGLWRPWTRLMGWRTPASIEAYLSHGNDSAIWVRGRVLGNEPQQRALTTDGLRLHLRHTLHRWLTFEVPHVSVRVSFEGKTVQVETDSDGFFEAVFESTVKAQPHTRWAQARSEVVGTSETIRATHGVVLVGQDARRMIISDVDDTVIHTGATRLWTITRLTFFCGVHNRRVLEGVPKLYRELASEGTDGPANPIFYVSSSAWNLYDLVVRIMELGIVPRGPLMFQRLGLANNRFVREPGHRHKLTKIEGLLTDYPELRAILIGDSGQHDARLYADAAKLYPGRILAIYIRDVEADRGSPHDLEIQRALSEAEALDVPTLRFSTSAQMRNHAANHGWV